MSIYRKLFPKRNCQPCCQRICQAITISLRISICWDQIPHEVVYCTRDSEDIPQHTLSRQFYDHQLEVSTTFKTLPCRQNGGSHTWGRPSPPRDLTCNPPGSELPPLPTDSPQVASTKWLYQYPISRNWSGEVAQLWAGNRYLGTALLRALDDQIGDILARFQLASPSG